MSSHRDVLARLLDEGGAPSDVTSVPARVPPTTLVRGDEVIADGGEPRIVRDIEPATGEVRISFENGTGVVVPRALTLRVRR
jgi:hypothetical protein